MWLWWKFKIEHFLHIFLIQFKTFLQRHFQKDYLPLYQNGESIHEYTTFPYRNHSLSPFNSGKHEKIKTRCTLSRGLIRRSQMRLFACFEHTKNGAVCAFFASPKFIKSTQKKSKSSLFEAYVSGL